MLKLRLFLYSVILIVGLAVIFWFNRGWQVKKFYRKTVQPLAEIKMRYELRHDNIVLALTTTPYRIHKLRSVLETLYKQNVNISKIYLSVPYIFKRDNVAYEIPQWLQDDSRVTIVRSDDFGPATKLLGVLNNVAIPPNTIIITVDDDMYYPQNLVLSLAYDAKLNPAKVVTTIGADIDYDDNHKIRNRAMKMGLKLRFEPDHLVTLVLGYAGVAYRAEFFDEQIFKLSAAPTECYMNDDFYISFHLARRDIPRKNLNSAYVSEYDVKFDKQASFQPGALFRVAPNRAHDTSICLTYLQTQYPNVNF